MTDINLWLPKGKLRLFTHPEGLKYKLLLEDMCLNVCTVAVAKPIMVGHDAGLGIPNSKTHLKKPSHNGPKYSHRFLW